MYKILFTGDVCLSNRHDVGFAEARGILADLGNLLADADLRVMNLESPVANEGVGAPIRKSGPNLISRPDNLGFIKAAGAELVTLANNHTGDYGDAALLQTLSLLDDAGISHIGAGTDIEKAYSAYRNAALSLSVLSVCENEFGVATKSSAGSAGYSLTRIKDAIAREKKVSKAVVVSFHGGCERNPVPSPMCIERYRNLIDMGADAVISGHTHCVQGAEYYRGKPIIYSMGNFCFPKPAATMRGAWHWGYTVTLTVSGEKLTYELTPYYSEPDTAVMHLMRGDKLKAAMAYIDKLSGIIANEDAVQSLFDGWCMGEGISYTGSITQFTKENTLIENQPADIAPTKNLFSCESHCELMKNTLNILFFGRMNEAKLMASQIAELQSEADKIMFGD